MIGWKQCLIFWICTAVATLMPPRKGVICNREPEWDDKSVKAGIVGRLKQYTALLSGVSNRIERPSPNLESCTKSPSNVNLTWVSCARSPGTSRRVFPRQKRGVVGSLLSGQLRNDTELSLLRREPVRIDNIRCCHIFSLKTEL